MPFGLETYTFSELKTIASELDISYKKSREETIKDIAKCFNIYEEYKKEKLDRYVKKERLGKGKEGTVYSVIDNKKPHKHELVMKCFRSSKSSDKLKKEFKFLLDASKLGISPMPYNYDTVSKYIVMERLDMHLYKDLDKKMGKFSLKYQTRLVDIYKILDDLKIFHNDPNIANYMIKDGVLYVIDFGFAKSINDSLIKKVGTDRPNSTLGLFSFIGKLKDAKAPKESYRYLLEKLPASFRAKLKDD